MLKPLLFEDCSAGEGTRFEAATIVGVYCLTMHGDYWEWFLCKGPQHTKHYFCTSRSAAMQAVQTDHDERVRPYLA